MPEPIINPAPPADPAPVTPPADPTPPSGMNAKEIQAIVDSAVTGLREKNSELLSTVSNMKSKLETFENLGDADNLANLVAQIESAEEQRMLQEGNIEGVVDNRTKTMKAKYEKENTSLQEELALAVEDNKLLRTQYDSTVLNHNLRVAAEKAGVKPGAIDHALFSAGQVFHLEEGNVVARDNSNEVIIGTSGKGSMSAFEYFDQKLKAESPHLYPGSEGAGFQGSVQKATLEDRMKAAAEAGKWDTYNKLRAQRAKSMAA